MKRKVVLEGLCASLAVVCALGIVLTQARTGNQENENDINEVNEVSEINEYQASDGTAADIVINYGGLENRKIEEGMIPVIDSDCTVHTYSPDRVEIKHDPETAQWEGKTDYEP